MAKVVGIYTEGNFASGHTLTILQYPHQMELKLMILVGSPGVSDHNQIMLDLTLLRQLVGFVASAIHQRFKSLEFSCKDIKRKKESFLMCI
ncbi:MAG: hypothetical protein R6U40_07645 [Desulfobacterales bacterium]